MTHCSITTIAPFPISRLSCILYGTVCQKIRPNSLSVFLLSFHSWTHPSQAFITANPLKPLVRVSEFHEANRVLIPLPSSYFTYHWDLTCLIDPLLKSFLQLSSWIPPQPHRLFLGNPITAPSCSPQIFPQREVQWPHVGSLKLAMG